MREQLTLLSDFYNVQGGNAEQADLDPRAMQKACLHQIANSFKALDQSLSTSKREGLLTREFLLWAARVFSALGNVAVYDKTKAKAYQSKITETQAQALNELKVLLDSNNTISNEQSLKEITNSRNYGGSGAGNALRAKKDCLTDTLTPVLNLMKKHEVEFTQLLYNYHNIRSLVAERELKQQDLPASNEKEDVNPFYKMVTSINMEITKTHANGVLQNLAGLDLRALAQSDDNLIKVIAKLYSQIQFFLEAKQSPLQDLTSLSLYQLENIKNGLVGINKRLGIEALNADLLSASEIVKKARTLITDAEAEQLGDDLNQPFSRISIEVRKACFFLQRLNRYRKFEENTLVWPIIVEITSLNLESHPKARFDTSLFYLFNSIINLYPDLHSDRDKLINDFTVYTNQSIFVQNYNSEVYSEEALMEMLRLPNVNRQRIRILFNNNGVRR